MAGDNMATFLDLLQQSVIVQGIITVLLIGACVFLWTSGKAIPPDLSALTYIVVGFYFGAKVQNALHSNKATIEQAKAKIEKDC